MMMVIVKSSVKRGKDTFLLIILVRTNLGISHESRLLSIIIVWHILFFRGKRLGNSSTAFGARSCVCVVALGRYPSLYSDVTSNDCIAFDTFIRIRIVRRTPFNA